MIDGGEMRKSSAARRKVLFQRSRGLIREAKENRLFLVKATRPLLYPTSPRRTASSSPTRIANQSEFEATTASQW